MLDGIMKGDAFVKRQKPKRREEIGRGGGLLHGSVK